MTGRRAWPAAHAAPCGEQATRRMWGAAPGRHLLGLLLGDGLSGTHPLPQATGAGNRYARLLPSFMDMQMDRSALTLTEGRLVGAHVPVCTASSAHAWDATTLRSNSPSSGPAHLPSRQPAARTQRDCLGSTGLSGALAQGTAPIAPSRLVAAALTARSATRSRGRGGSRRLRRARRWCAASRSTGRHRRRPF